ncbi:MAG: hypothetical protein R3E31_02365 [Chloroflexota bacterium]
MSGLSDDIIHLPLFYNWAKDGLGIGKCDENGRFRHISQSLSPICPQIFAQITLALINQRIVLATHRVAAFRINVLSYLVPEAERTKLNLEKIDVT